MFIKTPDNTYAAEPLLGLEWLIHGFGTRDSGGVWLEPERLAMLNQVHSATVVEADGRTGFLRHIDLSKPRRNPSHRRTLWG